MFQSYDRIHRDRAARFEADAQVARATAALSRAARLERTAQVVETISAWANRWAMRMLERAHDRRAQLL